MKKMFTSVVLSESVGANATKDESKDPENASSAMLRQGILPKMRAFLLDGNNEGKEASRELPETVR